MHAPGSLVRVVNIAAYKFTPLTQLGERRVRLREFCRRLELKGTILLSPEGVNLFVAGERAPIDALVEVLENDPEIGPLEVKRSYNDYQPFTRMLVKLKREIITFDVDGIAPAKQTSPKLAPQELRRWLDEGRPCTLLDVRNDYEVRLGTFRQAQALGIDHFRQFPHAVSELDPKLREQPVVMFCTGGIRCEKAGPFMEQAGFPEVYQLEGGILKYFEQCGASHFEGECFVFDKRTALDPDLRETATTLCYACQSPLTAEQQASPHYVPSVSCPYCIEGTAPGRQ